MTELKAGFGISAITPKVGAELAGYSNRAGPSTGIHDDLHSRALVVEGDDSIWALSANEICFLSQLTVDRIRERVAERTPIPESNVFLSTVHTHSGPFDDNPQEWEQPLPDLVGDAIEPGSYMDELGRDVIVPAGACELADRTQTDNLDPQLDALLTGVKSSSETQKDFRLFQNQPNPFKKF